MKAICLISGGIDSSVAAAILKKEGFEVEGIFMKLAENETFKRAQKRAEKVAKILKIPFSVLDLRKEFKKRIIENFLEDLKSGITPNPCVLCNKKIKFGIILKEILKRKADFIASGHYARVKKIKIQNSRAERKNSKFIYKLLEAKDKNKDQSYFLWMLNQDQLRRILFPIGNYTRKEVENLAREFKLPVLKARKSVEICFLQTTINDFLKKYLKEKAGKIVDKKGKILGEHKGLWFYTIGQRKGIGVSGGPWWVLKKELKKDLLIITKNERDLYKKELICQNVNWISGVEPKLPLKVKAKIRYRHKPASAILKRNLKFKVYSLKFKEAQRAITPGQSVVFYRKKEVLGGGIISRGQ